MSEPLQRVREMLDRSILIEQICAENGGIVKSLQDSKLAQPAIMIHLSYKSKSLNCKITQSLKF